MKKVKIQWSESFTTQIHRELVDIEIPDDVTGEQYLAELESNDPEKYEELMEQIRYEVDILKDKETNREEWVTFYDEDGKVID